MNPLASRGNFLNAFRTTRHGAITDSVAKRSAATEATTNRANKFVSSTTSGSGSLTLALLHMAVTDPPVHGRRVRNARSLIPDAALGKGEPNAERRLTCRYCAIIMVTLINMRFEALSISQSGSQAVRQSDQGIPARFAKRNRDPASLGRTTFTAGSNSETALSRTLPKMCVLFGEKTMGYLVKEKKYLTYIEALV